MNIKDFADKFIKAQTEAWIKGKVDAFEELEHYDVVYHIQPMKQDRVGLEGHKQFLITVNKAFTNIQMDWKYLTGEGNLFAVSYTASGIFTGEFPGAPSPTGKEVTINEIFLCRLEKGKIAEAWNAGSSTGIRFDQ
jgi:predicted ester cyclase